MLLAWASACSSTMCSVTAHPGTPRRSPLEPQRPVLAPVDRKDRECPRRLIDRRDRIKQSVLIESFVGTGAMHLEIKHLALTKPGGMQEWVENRLPPGRTARLVMIGAITLTSWARQAILTRSACCRREISMQPTSSASASV